MGDADEVLSWLLRIVRSSRRLWEETAPKVSGSVVEHSWAGEAEIVRRDAFLLGTNLRLNFLTSSLLLLQSTAEGSEKNADGSGKSNPDDNDSSAFLNVKLSILELTCDTLHMLKNKEQASSTSHHLTLYTYDFEHSDEFDGKENNDTTLNLLKVCISLLCYLLPK